MKAKMTVTVALPQEDVEAIDKIGKEEERTRSQVIRRIIRSKIEQIKDAEKE